MSIDGGAVEASWVVRSSDGRTISDCDCADPAIATVRFNLVGDKSDPSVAGSEPCRGRSECLFSCGRHTGTTPFDIPPGSYLMSIVPVDGAGQDLPGVAVVAPLLRDVKRGQPTQLDAFEMVAKCAASCAGANESKVCSH